MCPLPYPDRFNAAVTFVSRVPGEIRRSTRVRVTWASNRHCCLCLAVLVGTSIFQLLIHPLCTPTEANFGNETRLLFYALHKQATAGPCKEAKPWSWNVVESAKWQSWSQLADMTSMDAMRLYVKTLDEEQVMRAVEFS